MADDVDTEVRRRLGAELAEIDARILHLETELGDRLGYDRGPWLELEELLGRRAALREGEVLRVGLERGRCRAAAEARVGDAPLGRRDALRAVRDVADALVSLVDDALEAESLPRGPR